MENLGMIDPLFWKGRRVFITGHTGFKGSWLTQWLLLMDADVCGYALEPGTEPNLFDLLDFESSIRHHIGDVRDCDNLAGALKAFKPEVVFHLAAQPLVRLSYKEPRFTYETNVMGTVNLYEAVRSSESVRVVVTITSDKCYENREWVWGYRENEAMGGYDPYSSSKGCAELVTSAYRNSFFNPREFGKTHQVALASARAGNVIGGGDWASDRLIPDCIRALSRNEKISIRSPNATRPWQHVLEPLSGYLLLAQRLFADGVKFSEGWNFGPGDDGVMNVENVVKQVISCWGSGSYEVAKDADLHEAQLLKLDASKARALLFWKSLYSVEEAIEKSVEWYYRYYNGTKLDMIDVTRKQIVHFLNFLLNPVRV